MSDFHSLLEQEIPRLRRYARVMTRDRIEAEDLVQGCLMRALAKQHLWQRGSDLRAWLFTILHNLHVNKIRRSAREEKHAAAAAELLSPAPCDPAARLYLRDLDQAIGKLSEPQRQTIRLIGLDGMRYEQAAALLRVPVGTVRSRLGRGREALRRLLDRDERHPPRAAI